MRNREKTALFLIVVLFLLYISVKFILQRKGGFTLPERYWVLFAILVIALIGYIKKIYWVRYLTMLSSLAYFGFYSGSCLCETGAFEMLFVYIGMGKYSFIGMILLRIVVLIVIVYFFGNIFCGWVCHKGALQEFLYRERFAINIPWKVDFYLKKLRYFFLGLIIFYPLIKKQRIFNKIDPFKGIFNFTAEFYLLVLIVVFLVASIFIYRPFCRYICPLGALLGIINKIGLFKIELTDSTKCIHRNICEKKCPMKALKMKEKPEVSKEFCFACLECKLSCPFQCLKEKL